jgi:hypothetical protein
LQRPGVQNTKSRWVVAGRIYTPPEPKREQGIWHIAAATGIRLCLRTYQDHGAHADEATGPAITQPAAIALDRRRSLSRRFRSPLSDLDIRPHVTITDKGYDAKTKSDATRERGIYPVIPHLDQIHPHSVAAKLVLDATLSGEYFPLLPNIRGHSHGISVQQPFHHVSITDQIIFVAPCSHRPEGVDLVP